MIRPGRLPHDPIAVASAPRLYGTPMPASVVDRRGIDYQPQLGNNDLQPDCTSVAFANLILGISSIHQAPIIIAPGSQLRFYAASIGRPNATPEELQATSGAVALDVLRFQARAGYDIGGQAPIVGVPAVIDHTSRIALAGGVDRQMGVYLGIDLFARDMDALAAGQLLDAVPGVDPGPLDGGHMLGLWDYPGGLGDESLVRVPTYGALVAATWRWVMARAREAYVVRFPPPVMPAGVDVGIDPAYLAGWLREVGA